MAQVNKGQRQPTMVRIPCEGPDNLYTHFQRCAKGLLIPLSEYVAYRPAICDGRPIPDPILLAHPALVLLLDEEDRQEVMEQTEGLAKRLARTVQRMRDRAQHDAEYAENQRYAFEFLPDVPEGMRWVEERLVDNDELPLEGTAA